MEGITEEEELKSVHFTPPQSDCKQYVQTETKNEVTLVGSALGVKELE